MRKSGQMFIIHCPSTTDFLGKAFSCYNRRQRTAQKYKLVEIQDKAELSTTSESLLLRSEFSSETRQKGSRIDPDGLTIHLETY